MNDRVDHYKAVIKHPAIRKLVRLDTTDAGEELAPGWKKTGWTSYHHIATDTHGARMVWLHDECAVGALGWRADVFTNGKWRKVGGPYNDAVTALVAANILDWEPACG